MDEEITRADLNWLAHRIERRAKRIRGLTADDALTLRLIDFYREQMGWRDEPEEVHNEK